MDWRVVLLEVLEAVEQVIFINAVDRVGTLVAVVVGEGENKLLIVPRQSPGVRHAEIRGRLFKVNPLVKTNFG